LLRVSRSSPDRYAREMADEALGGMFGDSAARA
jgi:hypothetical protein